MSCKRLVVASSLLVTAVGSQTTLRSCLILRLKTRATALTFLEAAYLLQLIIRDRQSYYIQVRNFYSTYVLKLRSTQS